MNVIIKKYTDAFFGELISKFGFEIKTQIISDESYLMEYASETYVIQIEKYHREFYTSVYSLSDPDQGINISNLLEFLKREMGDKPELEEYFRTEKNIEECYRKQLKHTSKIIIDNLDLLDDFFSEDMYKRNALEFHNYWKSKHPELYRTL